MSKGFTIIEVIIVLVIGAVIMIAVFLVVPQLQRTQRDSARENTVRRIVVAVQQASSQGSVVNYNSGEAFFNSISSITGDLPGLATSASAETKNSTIPTCPIDCPNFQNSPAFVPSRFFVFKDHRCKIPTPTSNTDLASYVEPSTTNQLAVVNKREGGGAYCLSI